MRIPPAVAAGTLMPPHRTMRLFAAAMCAAALIGCSDSANPTGANEDLTGIAVTANVTNTQINLLVITVSASDIPTPLVFNLPVGTGGVATGTLRLPAGDDRLIVVQAFDVTGEVTHEASVTIDVLRGQNPALRLSLVPRNGQLPIDITMGPYSVVVGPASHTMQVGQTVQLTVTVSEPNGDAVATPGVLWATSDPSVASVNGSGLVTGHRAGQTTIVATYGGVAGAMTMRIADGEAPIEIVGPAFPPPGGVTFVGTGNSGLAGGRTNVYTAFDLSVTRVMAWGGDAASLPGVSFDGLGIDPSERMTVDVVGSNAAGGIIRWTGSTMVNTGGANVAVPTRFTLTITTSDGTVSTPVALVPAADAGLSPSIGWVAPIASSHSSGSSFRAHLFFEALWAGAWGPANTVFNNIPLKVAGVGNGTSFGAGFYYSF